ncbi:AI-2E family transporter [Paenibacillus sp. YN15]|uniref:AI-2E family transporter n=1 Tax=Paenibacillus sp. YN15 TaxID=1742774 RepID=UPI000DCC0233|nr:AI-2E family transporter [Paenibacillus sp. YN15]RAV01766.1 AI-2E family transporter [Paenibacillus sp. YN15]
MDYFRSLFSNPTMKRFSILGLICILLYFMRDMLNLVLLVFLFTFIMNSLQSHITAWLNRFFKVPYHVVVILLYLGVVGLVTLGIVMYSPKIVSQIRQLSDYLIKIAGNPPGNNTVSQYIADALKQMNFQSYLQHGFDYILIISNWGTTFLMALILSLFFILEKNRIVKFTSKLRHSKIGWLYQEMEYFGRKFVRSFGKVIEAQFMIALFNTAFTVVGLSLLGFPYLFALGIMVFVLSLIPVAGVMISLVPLGIIGYTLDGILMVVYVIVMITVLHFIEGYFLNPKLMSSKTNLPVFYTFVILLFSEHYLGVWGFIIGIPIFIFILDILDVSVLDEPKA